MSIEVLPKPAEYPFLLRSHDQRLEKIEVLKPDVMAEKLTTLTDEMRALKNALLAACGGLILLAFSIAFAFHH